MDSPEPVILHADLDAFYASVEQLDRPELRGLPVVVGGLGGRGVVTTASYEARPFGVHSAMPMVEARRLCPHAVFLPGRMERYAQMSRQVFAVFREFTPQVEALSLDEAFLDVTRGLRPFGGRLEIARELRARVRSRTGLTVSVGIAATKMAAKIASSKAKPDGLLDVPAETVEAFLAPLSVREIWGVGPVAAATLEGAGISTIRDLAVAPEGVLRSLGRGFTAFRELARGLDARAVDPDRERKSYGEENTFSADQSDGEKLRGTIAAHAEGVARRLRADARRARTVVLKVKLAERLAPGKYRSLSRSRTLAAATDDGPELARTALALWAAIAPGKRVRLVGVAAEGLEAAGSDQLSLLDDGPQRSRRLNRALDALAARFGDGVVLRGGVRPAERAAPTLSLKDRRRPEHEADR